MTASKVLQTLRDTCGCQLWAWFRILSSFMANVIRMAKRWRGGGRGAPLRGNREILVTADGHSLAGEIYRGIRTALLYSCPDTPPKSVLVASAAPGEGKTVSSINVGLAFAQMGARTLLVDADLRSSRCHEVLGLSNERGLSEVLTGQS